MPQVSDVLQSYIDNLMQQAGFDKLPEPFLDEQKERLKMEVQKRLGLEMIKHMNSKDIEALDGIMKTQGTNEAALLNFFQSKIPQFNTFVQQVLNSFAKEFITGIRTKP